VEWNPPPDRPPIKSAITWGTHLGVKIVTVPAHIDAQLPANRGRSGLHEFIAKNTGIRRADGQYVLSCSSDLVFSPDLLQYLSRRELTPDAVYRALRVNARALPDGIPPQAAPERCRREVIFAEMVEFRAFLPPERLDDLFRTNALSLFGNDPKLRTIFDFTHDHGPLRIEAPVLRQFPHLIHTNAAGDFTLISGEGWLKLGGYLENDCRNYVDSWFCVNAARAGFAQVILPMRMCIYHQEHDNPPMQPFWETYSQLGKLTPPPNWGLADEPLKVEMIQVGAGQD